MLNRRAQTTLEYAVLTAIIIGALITVGVYFKRGIQGRWKDAVDNLGEQYDPTATNTDITYRLMANTDTRITTKNVVGGGIWTMRSDQTNSLEQKTGYSSVSTTP